MRWHKFTAGSRHVSIAWAFTMRQFTMVMDGKKEYFYQGPDYSKDDDMFKENPAYLTTIIKRCRTYGFEIPKQVIDFLNEDKATLYEINEEVTHEFHDDIYVRSVEL